MHGGIDVSAAVGAAVVATADGVVTWAGPRGGLGNLVLIDHGQGLSTHYGHLSKVHAVVGEEIRRGRSVGEVGNTGRSTGPHLHYEIRLNGVPQDPERFILEPGLNELPGLSRR
jgi:murein DD-endopeptidase MepM/ murein hydrolase activator NlpD